MCTLQPILNKQKNILKNLHKFVEHESYTTVYINIFKNQKSGKCIQHICAQQGIIILQCYANQTYYIMHLMLMNFLLYIHQYFLGVAGWLWKGGVKLKTEFYEIHKFIFAFCVVLLYSKLVFNKNLLLQYSGWTINNKNNYYPVTVIFKQQTRKEHIVEFNRSQIKK